jgi:hypothetical protein
MSILNKGDKKVTQEILAEYWRITEIFSLLTSRIRSTFLFLLLLLLLLLLLPILLLLLLLISSRVCFACVFFQQFFLWR